MLRTLRRLKGGSEGADGPSATTGPRTPRPASTRGRVKPKDVSTPGVRANPILYADSQLVPYGTNSARKPDGPTKST